MSDSNCCFLTCIQISQEADQEVWYSHLLKNFPQFVVIHTVKDFGAVNKAKVDVFLELSCFFNDPADVGNLISGSSAFSKSSLNTWKFTVHILLKPSLKNFEHYFASVWDESNCAVAWTFFGIRMKIGLFQSCGHCWVFHICWYIEYSTFTASFWSFTNLLVVEIAQLEFPVLHLAFYLFYTLLLLLSHVWLFATPWAAAHQAYLSLTIS